jgi:hypothetical protein
MKTIANLIRVAAYRSLTVFKFTSKHDADEADKLLKQEIDWGTDLSYNRVQNDITVDKSKEMEVSKILEKAKLMFSVDEGLGRRAELAPKHFEPSITVVGKNPYGRHDTIYDVMTEHHKEPLQVLTGRKTLTGRDIEALKALGFIIYHKPEAKHL